MSDDTKQDPTSDMDDWASALAEQTAASQPAPIPVESVQSSAKVNVFQPLNLNSNKTGIAKADIDLILDVPVQLTAELGHTRITIKSLLQLSQGSVVELDGLAGEPMDVLINGYLIAQGEVVVVNEKFGIRLTDIITPSERIHKLNR